MYFCGNIEYLFIRVGIPTILTQLRNETFKYKKQI